MRFLFILLFSFNFTFAIAQKAATYATVFIKNPLPVERNDLVVVPWNALPRSIDTAVFLVVDAVTKKQLSFQFETKGSTQIQNLIIAVPLTAKAQRRIVLLKKKGAAIVPKTYGRYVPERKDDFAWENDRIAFRMYGKALESTNENAYGIDVWVKRTDSLIINQWYKSGDYHKDHGQGLDYYSVGNTLGAGDVAPFINDSLWFVHNYHEWEILDNGPLRTSFRLTYPNIKVGDEVLKVTKTISLDAGSQLNQITAAFFTDKSLPLAAGIVRRDKAAIQLLDEKNAILGYWEPAHVTAGTTGIGIIGSAEPARIIGDKKHWLMTGFSGKELTYYAGACWDKAGRLTSAEAWFAYLRQFRTQLFHPVQVRLEK